MLSNREQSTALPKNCRSKLQISRRLDNSLLASRHKKKKNKRKDIHELIHKIKIYGSSPYLVKLESSQGKDDNDEGEDNQIPTYEIFSEFMVMKNKVVSVEFF